jgi:hypothetical protein
MSWEKLQFFFFATFFLVPVLLADPTVGQIYSFTIVDVDQNKFATADGHVTVIVVASSIDTDRTRTVGDRIPEYCLGNPEYRMITVLRFEKRHYAPMRAIIKALVRRRLAAEAQRLQRRYAAKNLTCNARKDVFAATDFDGGIGSQLGIRSGSTVFQVLVLGRHGELLRLWTNVPTAEELAAVIK